MPEALLGSNASVKLAKDDEEVVEVDEEATLGMALIKSVDVGFGVELEVVEVDTVPIEIEEGELGVEDAGTVEVTVAIVLVSVLGVDAALDTLEDA